MVVLESPGKVLDFFCE